MPKFESNAKMEQKGVFSKVAGSRVQYEVFKPLLKACQKIVPIAASVEFGKQHLEFPNK